MRDAHIHDASAHAHAQETDEETTRPHLSIIATDGRAGRVVIIASSMKEVPSKALTRAPRGVTRGYIRAAVVWLREGSRGSAAGRPRVPRAAASKTGARGTPGRAFILGEGERGVQGRDEEQPTCFLLLLLLLLLSAKKINGVQAARDGVAARAVRQHR